MVFTTIPLDTAELGLWQCFCDCWMHVFSQLLLHQQSCTVNQFSLTCWSVCFFHLNQHMVYSWDNTEPLSLLCTRVNTCCQPRFLHRRGCCHVHREQQTRRQNGTTKCFIRTLLYLGCQRIRWKMGAGHRVIQFYLNSKKISLESQMERKLASQTLSNPSSLGLEVFPAGSRDVTITLALSEILKTIVQVQAQQAVDDLNNTHSKLIYSP